MYVVGRHEYGAEQSRRLVQRLRDRYVPRARFPSGDRVLVGGSPAQGVDYLYALLRWFPWLVAGALAAHVPRPPARVPLAAPAAEGRAARTCSPSPPCTGSSSSIFRFGVGADLFGLHKVDQIEGWIPIFLFAMLFGLSMDYEVFLVTRMRESWDATHDNAGAVAHGLERTGRIVTAAALIMVAAFSGFVAGRVAGLQEFGAGLALAILLDATARADDPRAVADGDLRPLELVAAVERGPGPPLHLHTIYLTIVIAKRIAGSSYPSARPGTSCSYVSTGIIP